MPIYEFQCGKCKVILEKILPMDAEAPLCCDAPMSRRPTFPAMVKVIGMGGYPSRRKYMKGSAPFTTRGTKPWLSYDPMDETINQIGEKKKDI